MDGDGGLGLEGGEEKEETVTAWEKQEGVRDDGKGERRRRRAMVINCFEL